MKHRPRALEPPKGAREDGFFMENEQLEHLRHSCAHLLAAAVMKLWPSAKRTIGPAIENGFYFDFDFGDVKVSENDFPKIEQKMHELAKTWKSFEKHELSPADAKKEYPGNEFKQELIDELAKTNQTLTFYKSGEYWDLCLGGHCAHPTQNSNTLDSFPSLVRIGAALRKTTC